MTGAEAVAFAERLARVASAGGGAKALAQQLAEYLDVAVLVEESGGRHIAAAANGRSVPGSLRALLPDDAGSVRGVIAIGNGLAGRAAPMLGADAQLGWLGIFGSGATGEVAEAALRLAAGAIAVELARESGRPHDRRRSFWRRLLAGEFSDTSVARDDASASGIALSTHYAVLAVEVEGEETSSESLAELRRYCTEAFRGLSGEHGTLTGGNQLLVVLPTPREVDAANARTAAQLIPRLAARHHSKLRMSGGIGSSLPAIQVQRSANEAAQALTIARRIFGSGPVLAYEELGAYPLLLRGASAEELRAFARRTLEPVRAYDDKHQTELEKTLRLYFESGQNVKSAASALNVHRHTVFYRLRQINEICARKLESAHDQLTLRMALAVDALDD